MRFVNKDVETAKEDLKQNNSISSESKDEVEDAKQGTQAKLK